MHFDAKEWTNLILRWVHVFAGIMWVGTTYYFTWLDGRFVELEKAADPNDKGDGKEVYMVHSGGFYRVEKQKKPSVMPEKLHWFRWEAALTWLSGLLLFVLLYYHGGLMVQLEDAPISNGAAIGLSIGLLLVGWVVYDLLWSSKLFANELVGVTVCYAMVVGLTYGLFHYLAARAACLQLGAMFGTIMTANVWMRILPAQKRMVKALREGQVPDQRQALRAKTRSKHNTFIVVPVVFLMISNHYPGTYHWATVSLLILAGWGAAKILRRA
ncbi:MAG TPA: urate hydroxylase PuuD [Candidatus Dormibacteraeota bacterium]|nr:urate hydroxylase PuuD [Candidatus Dormibacteraeota bacterium]